MTMSTEINGPQVQMPRSMFGLPGSMAGFRTNRLLLSLALLALAVWPGAVGEVTRAALEDAYLAVAVFVAATLLMFYGAEKALNFDIGAVFRRTRLSQVPLAAVLGALPGCGGAVVVVAAYASGNVTMGAVVATLTATMGDAAFLLIAKRPDAALVLLPVAFGAGIIAGYIVDLFEKRRFSEAGGISDAPHIGRTRWQDVLYLALAAPGLVFGVLGLAQVELSGVWADVALWLAMLGVGLSMLIWARSPVKSMTNAKDSAATRVTEETSFILAWVILAFLLFEYLYNFAGLDLEAMF
ncbi:hypothetical protein AB838_19320, partial [Rhodobacteraceae bacterium (ex Bugula neritina AB1)]